MSPKKRVFFALVIAAIIVLAVFSSFAINLFLRNTPTVELPDLTGPSASDPVPTDDFNLNGHLPVDITPETVQEVIRTLSRPDSYQRSLTVEYFWGNGESALTSLQIWQNGALSRTEVTPPTKLTQYNLTDGTYLYRWYGSSTSYAVLPLPEGQTDDALQRIPTYEDVLSLSQDTITDAGYEVKEELPCIYVEVTDGSYIMRYWISISSGLLSGAEMEVDGTVVYQMASYGPVITPCPHDSSFTLPDGTDLAAQSSS